MNIKSVEGRNFRSYSKINWSLETNGIYLIDAVNTESGRSNMCGKSTLCDSIFWALFGYLPKWNGPKGGPVDAVIKRGEKRCQVQVDLEYNGKKILIRRERPAKLYVEVDGLEVEGKSSDLDSRIPELIGFTAQQFLLSVYVSQGRKTSFFSMSDTERTELLSVAAQLEHLNIALEQVKLELKGQEAMAIRAENTAANLNEELQAFPARKEELNERYALISESITSSQQAIEDERKKSAANSALEKIRFDIKSHELLLFRDEDMFTLDTELNQAKEKKYKLSNQLKTASKPEPELYSNVTELTSLLEEMDSSNRELERVKSLNSQKREQAALEIVSAQNALNGICRHCDQGLPENKRIEAQSKHLEAAKFIESSLMEEWEKSDTSTVKTMIQTAVDSLSRRAAELDAEPNLIKLEIKTLDIQMSGIETKIKAAENDFNYKIKEAESVFKEFHSNSAATLESLHSAFRVLSAQEVEVAANAGRLDGEQASVEHRLCIATETLKQSNLKMDELLDLADLFGPKGLRVIYFESLIGRIGSRAGELFSLMTDGIYSTRIDQSSENAKGESKLVLRPIITRGGIEVPRDDLSGGAEAMASLAYDVAMAESMGDSNILFLDEALDGLDSQGKAQAMLLLESVSRNRAVYLIDHTAEIRSSIQNVIQIKYSKDTSELVSPSYREDDGHARLKIRES